MSMVRKLLLFPIMLMILGTTLAQVGTIKGTVKDALTGDAVIGANVLIAGTTEGTAVDVNGDFEIPQVKVGEHNLVISFVSYKTDTLKKVVVYPDQTTVIDHKMMEESMQLGEVVVAGARVTNTDYAVITEIRKNDLVVVGISS